MASPQKAPAAGALSTQDIVQRPLNYDRYKDIEPELTQDNLSDFISKISIKHKDELKQNVKYEFSNHSIACHTP